MLVCIVLSCLFLVELWSPVGKGLTSWLFCLLTERCTLLPKPGFRVSDRVRLNRPAQQQRLAKRLNFFIK